jgi:hypothetical protein
MTLTIKAVTAASTRVVIQLFFHPMCRERAHMNNEILCCSMSKRVSESAVMSWTSVCEHEYLVQQTL